MTGQTAWYVGNCVECKAFLFAIPTAPVVDLECLCLRCGSENIFHPETADAGNKPHRVLLNGSVVRNQRTSELCHSDSQSHSTLPAV